MTKMDNYLLKEILHIRCSSAKIFSLTPLNFSIFFLLQQLKSGLFEKSKYN